MNLPQLSETEQTALKSVGSASPAGVGAFEPKLFLEKLRRLLRGADPSSSLQTLEQAVTASVPDFVIAEVGDRDTTAFTAGIPYNFVHKNGQTGLKRQSDTYRVTPRC